MRIRRQSLQVDRFLNCGVVRLGHEVESLTQIVGREAVLRVGQDDRGIGVGVIVASSGAFWYVEVRHGDRVVLAYP